MEIHTKNRTTNIYSLALNLLSLSLSLPLSLSLSSFSSLSLYSFSSLSLSSFSLFLLSSLFPSSFSSPPSLLG